MKLRTLRVDGFGLWNRLTIEGLDEGLNVLYGPNEAGKTTLLEFVRTVLYGLNPQRTRYLPPWDGGEGGGGLELTHSAGLAKVTRDWDPTLQVLGSARVDGAQGARDGEAALRELLCGIDEPTYRNVFAVELQELQELATLSDTDAADLLYSIAAGVDRVSLTEVLEELRASRLRLLSAQGGRIPDLLRRREECCAQIEEAIAAGRTYGELAVQRRQLDEEIRQHEEQKTERSAELRLLALAQSIEPRWRQRANLDEQLGRLPPLTRAPEGALAHVEGLRARQQRWQTQAQELETQLASATAAVEAIPLNRPVLRNAARIEALLEHAPWFRSLQQQIDGLEEERQAIATELASLRKRAGIEEGQELRDLAAGGARLVAELRGPAALYRQAQAARRQTRSNLNEVRQSAADLQQQLDDALRDQPGRGLDEALQRAAAEVAQLRRRVQLDERLRQLGASQEDLTRQSQELMDQQMMAPWGVIGLGTGFMAGVVAIVVGLLLPVVLGTIGWPLVALGLVGSGAAAAAKVLLERSNARQLDACRSQLGLLEAQVRQVGEERDVLDQQLPRGNGPLQVRLEKAERNLTALEELVPLASQAKGAAEEAAAAGQQAKAGMTEWRQTRRNWDRAVRKLGLPPTVRPRHVARLVSYQRQVGQAQPRQQRLEEELLRRQQERDGLLARIREVAEACEVAAADQTPLALLQGLGETLRNQRGQRTRRRGLERQQQALARRLARKRHAHQRLAQREKALLRRWRAHSVDELRQALAERARAESLRQQREQLDREIHSALATDETYSAVEGLLAAESLESLTRRHDALQSQLVELENDLRQRFEQRGELGARMQTLAADPRIAQRQLDLGILEQQLADAIHRWRVLASTEQLLGEVRTAYERDHQPEALRSASKLLESLTLGKYCRVWVALGERALRIDAADGGTRSVEALSRGTREQLFLALRLALTSLYARRGVSLPVVLDDVLVNYDIHRAKAAAAVLREFAAEGHQVLVFTCHEHILKLFRGLHVPAASLPEGHSGTLTLSAAEPPPQRKGRRPARSEEPPPEPELPPEPEPPPEREPEPPPKREPEPPPEPEPSPPPEPVVEKKMLVAEPLPPPEPSLEVLEIQEETPLVAQAEPEPEPVAVLRVENPPPAPEPVDLWEEAPARTTCEDDLR